MTVFADSPDTAVVAGDIAAGVRMLLDAEVHVDEIRDLVERAIKDWISA